MAGARVRRVRQLGPAAPPEGAPPCPFRPPPPVAAASILVSRLECECSGTRSLRATGSFLSPFHRLFPFTISRVCFFQLSRWAFVIIAQLSGCGLGPEGARATACAASVAAPTAASASAPAAACAARGPSSPAIHAGMLMLVPLPRPRPAATALARAVALISSAAAPPSAAPTAVVAPAATGPFDIHAGRLTSREIPTRKRV